MIRKVAFQNFKVLADVELELEPFTVLVGPNASGKSTILDGLNRIANCRTGNIEPLLGGAEWEQGKNLPSLDSIITKGSGQTVAFSIADEVSTLLSVRLGLPNIATADPDSSPNWKWGDPIDTEKVGGLLVDEQLKPIAKTINSLRKSNSYQRLPYSIHLRLSGDKIASPSYSDAPDGIPKLQPDGKGLAAVLGNIKLSDNRRFERIQASLKQVVPIVEEIRLKGEPVKQENWVDYIPKGPQNPQDTRNGFRLIFDFENAKGIPAEDVSEGTLFALAILTVATDVENDWLILLDDIERGLHPIACGDLVKVLKNLVKEFPKLQIVATTHSPYLLNFVEPEEVRVVALDEQGHSAVAKLTDHPDFSKWKEALFPGEFWGQVGENWVTKLPVKQ